MPRKKKDSSPATTAVESLPTPTEPAAAAQAKPVKKKKGGRPKGSKNKKSAKAPKRYDPAVKAKILVAATGKPLSEGFAAAKKAGYRGSAPSLYMMLRNAGATGKKKRGRPQGSKNSPKTAPTIRRGPGRPAKSTVQSNGSGLGEIDRIVTREVQSRINAAARAAIAELQKLIS